MKINTEVKVEFTPDDLKEIIKNKLESEGYEIIDIKFGVKKHRRTEGFGVMEIDYEELKFLGATVKVKSK